VSARTGPARAGTARTGTARTGAARAEAGAATVTSPVPRDVWESVFRSDPGAVVSQSLAWHDAVFSDGRYQDLSLLYEFGSGRRVVLPLARHRWAGPAATVASWPGRWGVGGPLSEGGQVSAAEARAVLADVARRPALAAQIQLRHGADAAWRQESGELRAEPLGCHVLDLAGGWDQVWQHRFRSTARTAVRKAERGGLAVEVDRSGALLPVFHDLYEKSIQRWAANQREPLWLSRWRTMRATPPSMLAAVARQFGTDCGIWVARKDGVPVAAIIVLKSGAYAKYWRGAMDRELANPARANDLLHRLAIEDACEQGYGWYDMGYSRPGSPLAGFKEKLGAELQYGHTLRTERLPVQAARRKTRDLAKRVIGFKDV
jgi:Acetyltransferase (GNAT) domain